MFLPYDLIDADTPAHFAAARVLFEEYAAQLGFSEAELCFQNFAAELEQLSDMYGAPSGCLLLVRSGQEWVGCCAVRRFSADVCELKRLYIRKSYRGANLGRQLCESCVAKARVLGYRRMVLDTLQDMIAAQALYRSLGFREIEPYNLNTMAELIYMELDLVGAASGVLRA
jgi:ribosomal protein S18 acetylase RimI-like enzyme